jgi:hypothetical protein
LRLRDQAGGPAADNGKTDADGQQRFHGPSTYRYAIMIGSQGGRNAGPTERHRLLSPLPLADPSGATHSGSNALNMALWAAAGAPGSTRNASCKGRQQVSACRGSRNLSGPDRATASDASKSGGQARGRPP